MRKVYYRDDIKYEIVTAKYSRNIQGFINNACIGVVPINKEENLLQLFYQKSKEKRVFHLEDFR